MVAPEALGRSWLSHCEYLSAREYLKAVNV